MCIQHKHGGHCHGPAPEHARLAHPKQTSTPNQGTSGQGPKSPVHHCTCVGLPSHRPLNKREARTSQLQSQHCPSCGGFHPCLCPCLVQTGMVPRRQGELLLLSHVRSRPSRHSQPAQKRSLISRNNCRFTNVRGGSHFCHIRDIARHLAVAMFGWILSSCSFCPVLMDRVSFKVPYLEDAGSRAFENSID